MAKMKFVIVPAVILASLIQFGQPQLGELPIQIYYGTLCPDSQRFFQNQLNPIFDDIKDYVNFLFVPFGKASSTRDDAGNVSFECQHGPNDCLSGRAQLCALSYLSDNEAGQGAFVGCQMTPPVDYTGETCSSQVGVNSATLSECVNGDAGIQLQLEAEEFTSLIPLTYVPTIVFNFQFDQALSDRAEFELLEVICERIGNAAAICP